MRGLKRIYQHKCFYFKVCKEVTSQECYVMPYTKCKVSAYKTIINITDWRYEYIPVQKCETEYKNITIIQKRPKCGKVPKYICTYDKNNLPDCDLKFEEVCNLVDQETYIPVPKSVCRISHKLPFMNLVWYLKETVTYKVGHCRVIISCGIS